MIVSVCFLQWQDVMRLIRSSVTVSQNYGYIYQYSFFFNDIFYCQLTFSGFIISLLTSLTHIAPNDVIANKKSNDLLFLDFPTSPRSPILLDMHKFVSDSLIILNNAPPRYCIRIKTVI